MLWTAAQYLKHARKLAQFVHTNLMAPNSTIARIRPTSSIKNVQKAPVKIGCAEIFGFGGSRPIGRDTDQAILPQRHWGIARWAKSKILNPRTAASSSTHR